MTVIVSPSDQEAADRLRDRFRGLLLGLALGDALGATVQYRRAGTFGRIADLLGGGPYDLPPGAWSDDAATALHCADSLIAMERLDAPDIWRRWTGWRLAGEGSATGQCLGISAAMASALSQAPGLLPGSALDGEPLPRVAIAAAFWFADRRFALHKGAEMAQLTHSGMRTVEAARIYASWVVGALEGQAGERLLSAHNEDVSAERVLSDPAIARVRAGGWSAADEIIVEGARQGDAFSVLRVTYASCLLGKTFKETILAVVNAGGHSDVTGATVGALAGACYGASALPEKWLAVLRDREAIEARADRLLVSSLTMMLEETADIAT
jgi:hypothetical protein